MSDAPKARPKVPEGKTRFVTTTQKEPNEKGYVGYTTTWVPFQKEVSYTTPKAPLRQLAARASMGAQQLNADLVCDKHAFYSVLFLIRKYD